MVFHCLSTPRFYLNYTFSSLRTEKKYNDSIKQKCTTKIVVHFLPLEYIPLKNHANFAYTVSSNYFDETQYEDLTKIPVMNGDILQ